jgi:hypothetical protein
VPINNGLGTSLIETLAMDPVNRDILYAGTNKTAGTDQVRGLYKSTDGGATWRLSSQGLGDVVVKAVAVVGPATSGTQQGNTIYVGTNQGVFRSDDGAATWRQP